MGSAGLLTNVRNSGFNVLRHGLVAVDGVHRVEISPRVRHLYESQNTSRKKFTDGTKTLHMLRKLSNGIERG